MGKIQKDIKKEVKIVSNPFSLGKPSFFYMDAYAFIPFLCVFSKKVYLLILAYINTCITWIYDIYLYRYQDKVFFMKREYIYKEFSYPKLRLYIISFQAIFSSLSTVWLVIYKKMRFLIQINWGLAQRWTDIFTSCCQTWLVMAVALILEVLSWKQLKLTMPSLGIVVMSAPVIVF